MTGLTPPPGEEGGPSITAAPEPAPMGTVTEVFPELRKYYRSALQRLGQGERIRYELTILPLPNAAQEGSLIAMLVLYLEIPGAIVGTHLNASLVMELSGQDQAVADMHVRNVMIDLLDARSKQLDQQQTDMAAAQENGTPVPTAGIIMPPGVPNPPGDYRADSIDQYAQGL